MVKKNIVKKNNNIVKIGMIVPKLLNQETLSQIKNYKTIQYQFKFDEPVSIEVVKKFVSAFSIRTKETFDKINKSAKIFLAYYYTEIGRWIDCYGCNIGECPEIFDPALEYGEEFTGKPLSKIEYIDIYIMEVPKQGGNLKLEYQNDCLYYALLSAVQNNKNLLPKQIKSQKLLKSFLGLERGEKIDISLIHIVDELFNGYSIMVSGDAIYTSPKNTKLKINILFKNGHYSLLANEGRNKTSMKANKDKSSNDLYTYIFNSDNTCKIYGSNGEQIITKKEFLKMQDKQSKIYTLIRLIKYSKHKTLETVYNETKLQREELLKASDNKIDMFRFRSLNDLILDQFRMRSEILTEPDNISPQEAIFISNAYKGGLMWCDKKYEGELFEYDINSMYSSAMINQYFLFPVKAGHFMKLTQEEFLKMKYYKYGIYKCIVLNNGDEKFNKLFRFNDSNYYTHHDLTRAKELNFNIEMIEDNEANTLLYNKDDLICGNKVFTKYINYFYEMKKNKLTPESGISKLMLNKLHGLLCQKNIISAIATIDNPIDASKIDIVSIKRSMDGNVNIKYSDGKLFKTNFARIGAFLNAFARLRISRISFDYIDNIKKIHTDAIYLDVEMKIVENNNRNNKVVISDNIGDFKYKDLGNCRIVHINKIEKLI